MTITEGNYEVRLTTKLRHVKPTRAFRLSLVRLFKTLGMTEYPSGTKVVQLRLRLVDSQWCVPLQVPTT